MSPIDDQKHAWDERHGFTLLWTVLEVVCLHEDCDVGATECAQIKCVLPVMCRAQRRHRTSSPGRIVFPRSQAAVDTTGVGMREAGRDLEIQMAVLSSLKGQRCKALHVHLHPTVGNSVAQLEQSLKRGSRV